METIIENGTIVNEGVKRRASVVITDDTITEIVDNEVASRRVCDKRIDASGCYVLPGVIDSHVHFREPGLTYKADIESESKEAALGGVTTFFDMPNTVPQTTSTEQLEWKWERASADSHVNYAFFVGATNDNINDIVAIDKTAIPGIKLFMGSSTGNMLVDRVDVLKRLFQKAHVPIVAHCEDTTLIEKNLREALRQCGGEPPVELHPRIRSEEACYKSTSLAVSLAEQTGARLHIAHVSTAKEINLIHQYQISHPCYPHSNVTAEAVIAHLWFTSEDYKRMGSRIKCNPAVKTLHDRDVLRRALSDETIATIATDHAPHLLSEKEGGAKTAASGMPMIRFSLQAMMQLAEEGVVSVERLVQLMCHNPALLFSVYKRGFIRTGYKADITIVGKKPYKVSDDKLSYRYGWTPMDGETFDWSVIHTICNGKHLVDDGVINTNYRGEQVLFRQ